jgi:hypothetical protein
MSDKKISALPAATTPLAGTEVLPIVQGGTTDQVSVANLTAGRPVSMSAAAIGATLAPWTTLSPAQLGNGSVSGEASSVALSHNVYFNGGWKYIASATPAAQYDQYLGTHRWFTAIAGVADGAISFNYVMDLDTAGNLTAKTGNLVLGTAGKGIDFSANAHAPGMTSELLNDYEEGTFTPVLSSSATPPTVTAYTDQYGAYTKIGNRVFVTVNIRATITNAGTGYPVITGLPYAANAKCLNGPAWGLATAINLALNGNFVSGTTVQMAFASYNIANDYCCFSLMYEV